MGGSGPQVPGVLSDYIARGAAVWPAAPRRNGVFKTSETRARAPSSAMLRAVLLATLFAASSSYVLRFAHLPALFSLRSLMEDLPLSGLGRARPRLVAPRSDPDLLDLTLNYLGYCLMIYYLVCVCWDAATAEEQRITPSRNGSHRPGRHGPASPRSPRRSPSRAATPAPPRRSARLAALRE